VKKVVPAPLNPFPYDVSGFASLRQREREIDRQTETERDRGTETAIQRETEKEKETQRDFSGGGRVGEREIVF